MVVRPTSTPLAPARIGLRATTAARPQIDTGTESVHHFSNNLCGEEKLGATKSPPRQRPSSSSPLSNLSRSVAELWSYATSCGYHDTVSTPVSCSSRSGGPLHSIILNSPQSQSSNRFHTGLPVASSRQKDGSRKRTTMHVKTGTRSSSMNDMVENPPKSNALSSAATEDDELEEEGDDVAVAETEVAGSGQTVAVTEAGSCHLPTFAPAPLGGTSTTNNKKNSTVHNCFSEPPISLFTVRGPTYMIDQKKVASDPYLLTARGLDLFLTNKQNPVVLDQMTHALLGGQLRSKPTLAVNFRFPWGYMNLYFEVPAKLAVYLPNNENGTSSSSVLDDDSLTIAERTFALWLLGDTAYKNERLKLIPYVAQGPWVVRNMVTGRPAIIGKKLPVSYQSFATEHANASSSSSQQQQHPLLMATLDIGNSSAAAQRIVTVCRRYMAALTVDIGLVIQGTANEELPEQMMGAIRVHGPDPGQAPTVR